MSNGRDGQWGGGGRAAVRALALVAVAAAAVLWSCGPPILGTQPKDGGADAGGRGGGTNAGGGAGGGGPSCACDAGHCLADGGCGECADDSQCAAPLPRCLGGEARCVTCLPDAVDGCPAHQYCTATRTCLSGCANGSGCLSGECLPTHDCAGCETDLECTGGRLCGSGVCAAPCSAAVGCGGGRTCCDARCVDTTFDVGHCGACDAPCAAARFCGRGTCHDAVLASVCELPTAAALLNGIPVDEVAGVRMATALATVCTPSVVRVSDDELDGGVVNPATGRPRAVGALLTAGGGSYGHRLVGWIDDGRVGAIYDSTAPPTFSLSHRDGTVIVSADLSVLTERHDFFVVEVVRAPSGATALVAAGFFAPGTQAGAWWFINRVLAARATYADAWYVVEWTDGNGDLAPDAADTWRLVASGR